MMSKMKMAVLMAVTAVGAFQVGCTDREVFTGIVAGTVGLAIGSANANNPPPPPRQRCEWVEPVRVTEVYDGYYGRERHTYVRQGYYDCERYRRRNIEFGKVQSNDINVEDLMNAYKLNPVGAEKLAGVLTTTAANPADGAAAFASICVTSEDIQSAMKSNAMSDDKIDCIAKALDQKREYTRAMISGIAEMARAQQDARSQQNNLQ